MKAGRTVFAAHLMDLVMYVSLWWPCLTKLYGRIAIRLLTKLVQD